MTSHNAKCYSKICDGRSSKSGTLGKEWLNTVYNNHRGYTLLKWHTQIIKCCTGLQPQIIKLVIYWAAWTGRQAGRHLYYILTQPWGIPMASVYTYRHIQYPIILQEPCHKLAHYHARQHCLRQAEMSYSTLQSGFQSVCASFFFPFFSIFCNWAS